VYALMREVVRVEGGGKSVQEKTLILDLSHSETHSEIFRMENDS